MLYRALLEAPVALQKLDLLWWAIADLLYCVEKSHTMCCLQSIEDVEDTKDGATMHLQELSELIDQVRGNIQAIHGTQP